MSPKGLGGGRSRGLADPDAFRVLPCFPWFPYFARTAATTSFTAPTTAAGSSYWM